MSQILTTTLQRIRLQYIEILQENNGAQPLLVAEQLCSAELNFDVDSLAEVVAQDPTLLAARSAGLIRHRDEKENPCAGAVIAVNIHHGAIEMLLDTAIEHDWLVQNAQDDYMIDAAEIEAVDALEPQTIDYSESKIAVKNISVGGSGQLTQLLQSAEKAFLEQLATKVLDAYSLAIQTAGSHSVFAPEDIAPIVLDNPLMLALRADDLVVDEVFANDPPAGIIVSSHITQLIIDHLLDLATEKGALAFDSEGQLILPESGDQNPAIH